MVGNELQDLNSIGTIMNMINCMISFERTSIDELLSQTPEASFQDSLENGSR